MMIKNYEDWAAMDDLYMLLHTYVSDKLLKQLFDAGKKAGIESEQEKRRWIPTTERLPTKEDGEVIRSYAYDSSVVYYIVVIIKTKELNYSIPSKFYFDKNNFSDKYTVIAWKPLPEV